MNVNRAGERLLIALNKSERERGEIRVHHWSETAMAKAYRAQDVDAYAIALKELIRAGSRPSPS